MTDEQPTVAQQIITALHDAPTHVGLEWFRQLNAQLEEEGRELRFSERIALAREHFPSLNDLAKPKSDTTDAWLGIMGTGNEDEITIVGAVLRDIHEHDQATPGRSGPKPAVHDARRVHELHRQFLGEDHTTLPFKEIFAVLANGRSIRAMAAKCGLDRNKVARLLAGVGRGSQPTRDDMEKIAAAFRKHPSFFMEYRVQYLQADLTAQLHQIPEASIDLYRRRARR